MARNLSKLDEIVLLLHKGIKHSTLGGFILAKYSFKILCTQQLCVCVCVCEAILHKIAVNQENNTIKQWHK